MRTSVLCNLALVVSAAMVSARYTTSHPGPSSETETTPQLGSAPRRSRGAEGATGGEGANAVDFRQMSQGLLREQEAEGRAQEALRAQESNAEGSLQDAPQQVEAKLQVHDDAMRALLQKLLQQMEKQQEENDATRALLDKRLQQIEETLQRMDLAMPALLVDRLKGVEDRLGVLVEQQNPSTKEDGESFAEMKPLINQLDKRPLDLEANVQRALQQFPSSEPKVSIGNSPPTCIPASDLPSTSIFLPSSAPTAITTSFPTSFPSSSSILIPPSIPTSLPSSTVKSTLSPSTRTSGLSSAPTSTPSPSRLGYDLWKAARERNVERVRILLEEGADVNYRGDFGRSPVMEAIRHRGDRTPCNEAVVSLLMQRGALVSAVDDYGQTPLHFAAMHDTSARCVSLLVGAGAHVEARDKWRRTPLFQTNEGNVRALLDAGAHVNVRDEDGGTPLHSAAHGKSDVNVRALLVAGSDPNARDTWGRRPLHYAVANNNDAPVRALLSAGANASAVDNQGYTPLHWGVHQNNEATVRALLAAGAKKDLRGWTGNWKDKSPVDFATTNVSDTIKNLLRS